MIKLICISFLICNMRIILPIDWCYDLHTGVLWELNKGLGVVVLHKLYDNYYGRDERKQMTSGSSSHLNIYGQNQHSRVFWWVLIFSDLGPVFLGSQLDGLQWSRMPCPERLAEQQLSVVFPLPGTVTVVAFFFFLAL